MLFQGSVVVENRSDWWNHAFFGVATDVFPNAINSSSDCSSYVFFNRNHPFFCLTDALKNISFDISDMLNSL